MVNISFWAMAGGLDYRSGIGKSSAQHPFHSFIYCIHIRPTFLPVPVKHFLADEMRILHLIVNERNECFEEKI